MGEVYRARDTRLDRDVAIKVLPELFALDPERLTRFEREAKALASLSHPHIAQVYEIAELPSGETSVAALVMELVEGEDLSVRIARGPLPLSEGLPIALQIADALESAHERGIIHRDLKPANIKVSADGDVKVLDFGLAKAIEGSELAGDPVNSPTISIAGTRAGLILGTAAYMAPEQARGQSVDRRADIWSFGVVLFEMLSGKQTFGGETISDVLASVLKNDIDWTTLPPDLPAPIARLLQRCLTPDRRTRLRDIGEARIAIADFLAGKHDAAAAVPGRFSPREKTKFARALFVMTLIATALAVVLGFVGMNSRREAPAESRRLVVVPPIGVTADVAGRPSPSLAPDGWTLAFTGADKTDSKLYLRTPADFDPRPIGGTEGGSEPVFSPDGRTIAFATPSQLKIVSLDGAPPTVLAPMVDPRGLAWADNDTIVYAGEAVSGLSEIPARGGARRVLTTLNESAAERTHRWPHALPGGRWILFTVGTSTSPDSYEDARIEAVNRETGERRKVYEGASLARYAPTGHLILARGGSLYAVPFDPESLAVKGRPTVVVQGIGGDQTTGAVHLTWSGTGTLAYVPAGAQGGLRQLTWSDLKGTRQPIALPPALYNDIRLSPDGGRVAVTQGTSGVADIWLYSFALRTYTRLTFTSVNATPVWSADGRDIFFSSFDTSGSKTTIYRTPSAGGQNPSPVLSIDARVYLKQISADGTSALVDYTTGAALKSNVGRLPLKAGAAIEPLAATAADEYGAAASANGQLIAYESDAGGRPEVYVRAAGQTSGHWQISNAGGEEPRWSPDGKSIYYRFQGRLMRVPIVATDPFQAALPVMMFDNVYDLRSDTGVSYQTHPDGSRLLMTMAADITGGSTVRLVTGWFDELKKIR
jgi:serine/threonine-protein kinase